MTEILPDLTALKLRAYAHSRQVPEWLLLAIAYSVLIGSVKFSALYPRYVIRNFVKKSFVRTSKYFTGSTRHGKSRGRKVNRRDFLSQIILRDFSILLDVSKRPSHAQNLHQPRK